MRERPPLDGKVVEVQIDSKLTKHPMKHLRGQEGSTWAAGPSIGPH